MMAREGPQGGRRLLVVWDVLVGDSRERQWIQKELRGVKG